MARKWSRQDGDLKMLKALYKHKYLRGKILTLISGNSEQKGYDRISALKRQGLIASEAHIRQETVGSRVLNKKVAAIFYLTTKGTITTKNLITENSATGEERGRKPAIEEKERAYRTSLLLEGLIDLYDTFVSPTDYKLQQSIPNFIPIDLVYEEKLIFFDKPQMKQRITTECQGLQERFSGIRTLILTEGERQRINLVNYCKENYGQNELALPQDDFTAIRHILTPDHSFENYFSNNGFEIEELKKPLNGSNYLVNDEPANIYDIVGMPAKVLRRVKRASGKVYLLVSSPQEQKILYRHYPEYQDDKNIVVYVLSEILSKDPKALHPEPSQDKWASALECYLT